MSDDWQGQQEYFSKLFFDQPDSIVRMESLLVVSLRVSLRPTLPKLPRRNFPGLARIKPGDAIDTRWHSHRILALRVAQGPRSHFEATVGGIASPDYELVVNVATLRIVVVV